MNVAIRVKASRKTGMGHWVRQCILARAMQERGWKPSLYPDSYPALQTLPDPGVPVIPVTAERPFQDLLTPPVSLLVLDVQDTTGDFIQSLRPRAQWIVTFEDQGPGRQRVDAVVDCNLDPAQAAPLPAGVLPLFGLPYSLLHPAYATLWHRPRDFSRGVRTVLVTCGGTDPLELTAPLTRTLLDLPEKPEVTVVTGPGHDDGGHLQGLQSRRPFHHIAAPPDLVDIIKTHDAVICSGGVTLHEALAAGAPAFVLAQVPHQKAMTLQLEALGAARFLGDAKDWTASSIRQAMATDPETLARMSARGRELIDGQGLRRILQTLANLVGEKKSGNPC